MKTFEKNSSIPDNSSIQSNSKIENKKSLKRYKTGLLKKVILFFLAILFIVLERMFYPYFENWENDLISSIQTGPGPSLGIVNQTPANDWLKFNGALGELNYIFLISTHFYLTMYVSYDPLKCVKIMSVHYFGKKELIFQKEKEIFLLYFFRLKKY